MGNTSDQQIPMKLREDRLIGKILIFLEIAIILRVDHVQPGISPRDEPS